MSASATAAAAQAGVAEQSREATGRSRERALAFADFHIHTRHSRDSILREDRFVRAAIERGLTHVAVTNHNNVEGAMAVASQGARARARRAADRDPR